MGDKARLANPVSRHRDHAGLDRGRPGARPRQGNLCGDADRSRSNVAGVVAGFVIGIVAALLGVAGGELLIPTLVLLFGADIELAGSLSLAISLPTMLVGFARYSQDRSFAVLGHNRRFVLVMAAGSIVGSFIGVQLLGVVPTLALLPLLALILVLSAFNVWRHK